VLDKSYLNCYDHAAFTLVMHFHSLCAVKKAEWGAKHHFALQLMAVRYKEFGAEIAPLVL
jgi:hypothetical protein